MKNTILIRRNICTNICHICVQNAYKITTKNQIANLRHCFSTGTVERRSGKISPSQLTPSVMYVKHINPTMKY